MSTGTERTSDNTVDRLRQEFEKLIEGVWSQGEKAADMMGLRPSARTWVPSADVIELPTSVQVTLDIPGIDPQQVEILLVGNMLTVKGERLSIATGAHETVHRKERMTGAFHRAIPLPVTVDPNDVRAVSRNGVITVTIGKPPSLKPHEIRVQVETPPCPPSM
jgi:HSP20 family protein